MMIYDYDVSVSKIFVHQDLVIKKKQCFLIITALTYQKPKPFIRLIKHTTYVNRLVTMLWCFYWDFYLHSDNRVDVEDFANKEQQSNDDMINSNDIILRWVFWIIGEWRHNTKHEQKLKHVHSWQHTYKISWTVKQQYIISMITINSEHNANHTNQPDNYNQWQHAICYDIWRLYTKQSRYYISELW